MEIVVTGRHTQVKQRFRDVVETKMNRVTAIAPDAQRARRLVLTRQEQPASGRYRQARGNHRYRRTYRGACGGFQHR